MRAGGVLRTLVSRAHQSASGPRRDAVAAASKELPHMTTIAAASARTAFDELRRLLREAAFC